MNGAGLVVVIAVTFGAIAYAIKSIIRHQLKKHLRQFEIDIREKISKFRDDYKHIEFIILEESRLIFEHADDYQELIKSATDKESREYYQGCYNCVVGKSLHDNYQFYLKNLNNLKGEVSRRIASLESHPFFELGDAHPLYEIMRGVKWVIKEAQQEYSRA